MTYLSTVRGLASVDRAPEFRLMMRAHTLDLQKHPDSELKSMNPVRYVIYSNSARVLGAALDRISAA